MEKFKTKAEMEWYIQGLKDAKNTAQQSIEIEIRRYTDTIPFMDFKKTKPNEK